MRKLSVLLLALLYIGAPTKTQAQNNGGAIAGALVGAIAVGAAAAAANEAYKEAIELQATQYILANTDMTVFSLSAFSASGGTKAKDQSAVSIFAFRLNNKSTGKRQVMLALLSKGWANEYGVDYSKIKWEILDGQQWIKMAQAYVWRASDVDLDESKLIQSDIVNNGVKYNGKMIVKFPKLSGDYYKVKDYSDDYKIVFNEKSFGLFIKETKDLVQLRRGTIVEIHKFLAGRK